MPDQPKVELHCHLEGTIPPDLVHRLADRNNMSIPDSLFNDHGSYEWHDFPAFLNAFDLASSCILTVEDYRDVTFEYLSSCAGEGAIYVEMFSSSDHAAEAGMSYSDHIDGIVQGIDDAERDHGIIGRIIPTCVRHLGAEQAMNVARQLIDNPHPYVVGFGMGGNELFGTFADFAPAFNLVAESGLPCTAHAGEVQGAESVRQAITHLPLSRIGHGVRSIEDPALVSEIVDRGISLEICPGSNLRLGVFESAEHHPLRKLLDAGCRISLGSDDPPFFDTSIGKEYTRAKSDFGLSNEELSAITAMAIESSFADEQTKAKLRAQL